MVNKATRAHGGGSGWHDYTVLGFVCCSSDCKITTALFPVVFNDSRLKLYFQPASESPKTVSLSCTRGIGWEDGIQLEVV